MLTVVKRQLSDHLESGTYGVASEPDLKSPKNIWRLRDFCLQCKPNASLRHHSAINMLKRNKTIKWLKTKSENSRKLLLSKARKSAKILKLKDITHEQNVLEARKKQLQDTKRKKQQLQQKKENELNGM